MKRMQGIQLYTRRYYILQIYTAHTMICATQIRNGSSTILLGEDGSATSGPGVLALREDEVPSHESRKDLPRELLP